MNECNNTSRYITHLKLHAKKYISCLNNEQYIFLSSN